MVTYNHFSISFKTNCAFLIPSFNLRNVPPSVCYFRNEPLN
ncbi:MAG: hypothetical protein ACTS42_01630 [Candidatus Hodgkinia cicadicola]